MFFFPRYRYIGLLLLLAVVGDLVEVFMCSMYVVVIIVIVVEQGAEFKAGVVCVKYVIVYSTNIKRPFRSW